MSDPADPLLELRHRGVRRHPKPGDEADHRIRQILQQEIAGPRGGSRRIRRGIALGGFGLTPPALIAVAAAAAAGTGGAVLVVKETKTKPVPSPAKLFTKNPGSPYAHAHAHAQRRFSPDTIFHKETVVRSSVRDRVDATVPGYGRVQFWSARTKQGGFCYAIRLPDGSWAGYPLVQHPTNGYFGGTVPGCIDTEQQRSIGENGQPSVEAPTETEGFDEEVKNHTGKTWGIYFGYVTTEGNATAVRDQNTGRSGAVTADGYFLLIEPYSFNSAADEFKVLDASGQELQPDYARDGLLPGYRLGPTGRSNSGVSGTS